MEDFHVKYRPKSLKTMVGNESVVATVQTWLDNEAVPGAILIHGAYGCGKTTLARIIALALDCDLYEYNSSATRGIDDVRNWMADVPVKALGNRPKCYIFDEVHNMTADAQNAALKVLEEVPKHVKIIFCTTDPQKLKKTVQSRMAKLEIQPIENKDIYGLLHRICKREDKVVPEAVLKHIVKTCENSARNALVSLQGVVDLPPAKMANAIKTIEASVEDTKKLFQLLLNGKPWSQVAACLKGIKTPDESIRIGGLAYMSAVLLSGGDRGAAAYTIMDAFREPFYNKGLLTLACYEIVNAE